MRKRKLTRKDFMLEPTAVWVETESVVELSPFFLQWWQDLSMQRYGDKEHCVKVAEELGYLWRYRDQNTGDICYDPIGFDYDPVLYRTSMNTPQDMPLVHQDDSRRDEYNRLWQLLLSDGEGK